MFEIVLLIHLIAATIWTGGHIVLSTVILPKVLKEKSPSRLLEFETVFEKIGMPSLIIQIVTGLYMSYQLLPNISEWFNFVNPVAHPIALKLTLLFLTFALALDAKFRVIPKLSKDNLVDMAWHIIGVTIISIIFVFAGVSFRSGWLS